MAVLVMIPTLREAEALLGPVAARQALEGRGTIGGQPCSLVGMGPIEAAVGAGRAFARHPEVQAGLLLGLGGSYDLKRAPRGALVRAEWFGLDPAPLAFLEKGARLGLEGELEARHPMPAEGLPAALGNWEGSEEILSGGFVTVAAPSEEPGVGRELGPGLEGAKLGPRRGGAKMGPGLKGAQLGPGLEGALVEEMEGYAVARAGMAFGKGLASLRAISNGVGERDLAVWDLEGAFRALRRVVEVLQGGLG
ncbi:MAG TPA: hypothetical protein ENK02_12915 [Planctomycetes bacterium]|nr:hypothetical protein [Planctomycetota bacterium]